MIEYLTIHRGKAAEFRENCAKMVSLRSKEPGHLATAYSFDRDRKAVSREDYESAEAVLRHMKIGAHIFENTRNLVDITGAESHGPAEELVTLRVVLSEMSPKLLVTEYGFRR